MLPPLTQDALYIFTYVVYVCSKHFIVQRASWVKGCGGGGGGGEHLKTNMKIFHFQSQKNGAGMGSNSQALDQQSDSLPIAIQGPAHK